VKRELQGGKIEDIGIEPGVRVVTRHTGWAPDKGTIISLLDKPRREKGEE